MAFQELQVTPASHNFGNVAVGAFAEVTIELRNESSPSISMSGSVGSLSAPYNVQSGGGAFFLSGHGQTKNVVLRFTPSASGVFNATLSITHNAPSPASPIQVSLTGTGIYALDTTKKTAAGEVRLLIYGPSVFTDARLASISPIEHGYDDNDETIVFPSNCTIKLFDPGKQAYDRLKLNEDKVEVYLNSVRQYVGRVYVSETYHDEKRGETSVLIVDGMQKLKNLKIRDSAGNQVTDLGYSDNEYHKLVDLVRDIFKQINPDVTLNVEHDWEFRYAGVTSGGINDLYFNTRCWFGAPTLPFEFLTDLLKHRG